MPFNIIEPAWRGAVGYDPSNRPEVIDANLQQN